MVVASLLMCFIVLIQNSKGGGLASGFSSSNQIMGVRKTTDFLEKGTWFLAGFMVVMSIATAYVVPTSSGKGGDVILEQAQKEEKTNLVTTGIYSISRNPAFLGFDLMYIGILFSFFNWFLCFATGFAVVFFHLQIVNVEEDFLIEAFGNEYLQYKSKVCRYLGRKR